MNDKNHIRIGIDVDAKNNYDGMGATAKSLLPILEKKQGIELIHLASSDNYTNFIFKYLIEFHKKIIRTLSGSYFDAYFESVVLPKLIRQKNIQIYHSLGSIVPQKTNCITIQTCYDISYYYEKNYLSTSLINYYEKFVKKSALSATHTVAVSESTKNDLINLWEIPESKISVIHLGVDIKKYSIKKISNKYFNSITGVNYKYLLFVGNLNSRKNGIRLIKSFHLIASKYPLLKLIFIGSPGNDEINLKKLVTELNLQDRVLFLGRVSCDILVAYYQYAEVFCYPSLHEGFGLPILESMAAGTPVLTSDSISMKEIAGNSAILVDPYDVFSIADGIERALENRFEYIAKGSKHVNDYTWDLSAEKLLKLYQLLLHKNGSYYSADQ